MPTNFQEWIDRSDDVTGKPFVVTFKDKTVFPASDYYGSIDVAVKAAKDRPADFIMERKIDGKGREVARIMR